MRQEQIPYGVKDFKRVRVEDFYYVDKSAFIEKMERRANFLFFVRPRRFGKSMLCEMLKCYYDVAEKDNFEKLFGGLYAGSHPTANANRYFVLALDFSRVNACEGKSWEEKFQTYMNNQLDGFIASHRPWLADDARISILLGGTNATGKYGAVYEAAKRLGRDLFRLEEIDPKTGAKTA